MFCPKCGKQLNGNEQFCSSCGTHINNNQNNTVSKINGSRQSTLTEQLIDQTSKFLEPIKEKTKRIFNILKNLFIKYKKQILIIITIIILVIIGILLFNQLYDFTKIEWDKENGDASVTTTTATKLNLNVLAYDKEKNPIIDIKFEVSEGKITSVGNSVEWTIPNKSGTYTITAIAPSGKKITKEIEFIKSNENVLNGVEEELPKDEDDNDKDGLTNIKEKELNTNPDLSDTDRDGITDYYEINKSKTNPLKKDTDGDGINDGDELDLELDPLKKDSKGDGIEDCNRILSYNIKNDEIGVTLEINGKGNIASTTIDVFENSAFSDIDGLINKIYNFYSNGEINSANVTIKYNLGDVKNNGINEDNLTVYYFNEETKELEAIPTKIDKKNKTLTVTLNHFSKYLIGDSNVVVAKTSSEILFVIDDSISMYSTKQMELAGFDNSTGAVGNDTTFKRLSLTNKLIDMFSGNYTFGVSEFSGQYVKIKDFDNNQTAVKEAVNGIKNNFDNNKDGTNIITALTSGIKEFSKKENNNYLILLTDGKNTTGSLSSKKNTIITSAKKKNIKICVIGLGSQIDSTELNEIAEGTGCDYYNATDSSALDEIYSLMGANINYNYVDTNDDSKTDGMIMEDSGFIVNRDGFSFANFISNKTEKGHCYGMATFAMLYYTKELPMSLGYAHKYTIFKRFLPSDGYDLKDTYFSSYNNLYDFKPENIALTYYLYNDSIPSDFRDRIENDIWMIKKEYHDEFIKIGSIVRIKDYHGNNKDFSKYQGVLLNIDSETFENNVSKDESQIMQSIYRLFILQVDDERTSFSTNPDQAFNELKTQLENKVPVVLNIGGHAVNAIRLIQDNTDSNKFKLEVYDNNRPGQTEYIEITRSKYSKWQFSYTAWTNEYEYTFKYDKDNDGILDDITLELCYPKFE